MALSYAFNANTDTAAQLAERRRIADILAGRIGGATTYGGGIGDLFSGLAVGLSRYKTGKAQKAGEAGAKTQRDKLFRGMFSGADNGTLKKTVASTLAGGGDPLAAYSDSIGGMESGRNYSALGPVTKTGDRAYGFHQVMGNNIPDWSEAATGQRLTPEEFLAMPSAQDRVFRDRFGGYLENNSPQDAASMWFTGKPLAQGAGLQDQLGTSGQEYADKFMAGLGGQSMPMVPQFATYTPPPPADQPQPAGGPTGPQMAPQRPPPADPATAMAPATNAAVAQMQPAGGDDAQIQQMMQFLSNDFATDADKAFVQQRLNSILEKREQASDPKYQMELQSLKQGLELGYLKEVGGSIVDMRTGRAVYTAPPDAPEDTAEIKNFKYGKLNKDFAAQQGGGGLFEGNSVEAQSLNMLIEKGAITQEQAAQLGAGKTVTDPTSGAVIFLTPQGVFQKPPQDAAEGAPQQQSGVIEVMPGNKPLFNEGQGKAAGFADRMAQSMPLIETYSEAGTNFTDRAVDALLPDIIGNYAKSEEYKLLTQAQSDFINAQLRRESGAIIGEPEIANAKQQYFPQPDDSAQLLEQKRANRQAAFEAMQRDAGPSYKPKAPASGPPRVSNKTQYDALPSGTLYIAPDGKQRKKP